MWRRRWWGSPRCRRRSPWWRRRCLRCPGFRQSHFLELSERCIRNSLNAGEIPGEHCERPHAAVQGCEGGLQVTECYLLVAPVEETGGDLPVDMRGVSGAAPAVTPPLSETVETHPRSLESHMDTPHLHISPVLSHRTGFSCHLTGIPALHHHPPPPSSSLLTFIAQIAQKPLRSHINQL